MGKRRLEEYRAGRESSTLAKDSRGNWAIAEGEGIVKGRQQERGRQEGDQKKVRG